MYADFYNGSDWVITSVDVQVGSLNKEMSEEYPSSAPWFDKRTFRLKIPQNDSDDSDEMKTNGILMPLSSARFEAYIGDFIEDTGKGGWEWGIEAVHGFKP